jgi:hypothetical protein
MEVVQSMGAPLDAGFREIRLQEVEIIDSCSEDVNRIGAGRGKACMPLFRAGVRP